MLLLSQLGTAQINLEHTFDAYVSTYGGFFLPPSLECYTYFNSETKQMRVYNEDYSLYKSISFTPPASYSTSGMSVLKNIFTTDGKLTFLVTFTNPDMINTNSWNALRLYDENGTLLKDFGYAYLFTSNIHVTSNKKYRLALIRYKATNPSTHTTEIYSLPGTPPVGVVEQKVNANLPPYPNPTNTVITLPYQLSQGEMSVMRIFNINGQLIETKQIDYVFDKILLNVSSYAKGIYFYEVNGISNRFIVD